MEEIKVVIHGYGAVGAGIVNVLSKRKGIKVVGAIARSADKQGKDIGTLGGFDPVGVVIENDLLAVCDREKPDVVICTASTGTPRESFEAMRPVIEKGINVIEANTVITCLWQGEENLAAEIDAVCKEHGTSYIGMGNTQTTERLIFALAEGVTNIRKIKFTHFADVHAFSPESNANRLGITLPIDEYNKRFSDDKPAKDKWRYDVCYGVAAKLGWTLDEVKFERKIDTDENGIVSANTSSLTGYMNGKEMLQMDWVFIMDPEKRYYDRIEIDGAPYVDSVNNFSPNRGKASTIASLSNAIPYVVKADSGYISSFDIDLTLPLDDVRIL